MSDSDNNGKMCMELFEEENQPNQDPDAQARKENTHVPGKKKEAEKPKAFAHNQLYQYLDLAIHDRKTKIEPSEATDNQLYQYLDLAIHDRKTKIEPSEATEILQNCAKKRKMRMELFEEENQPNQDPDAQARKENTHVPGKKEEEEKPKAYAYAHNQLYQHLGHIHDGKTKIEPSEATEILQNCAKNENQIEYLSEAYHLVHGGPRSLIDSSPLTQIKTPVLENTVLHIAARCGNNDVVDLVAKHDPQILFSLNKEEDTALHVAARAGHIPTIKKLLEAYANMEKLLEHVKKINLQGNTMLHEAMICGKSTGAMIFQTFELYNTKDHTGQSLSESCYKYALTITNKAKQSVLYLAVEAGDKEAVKLILDKCPKDAVPVGLSPLVAAIMKRDEDMLSIMLDKKPNWIHLQDKHKRLPLHYAASTGYQKGVADLLDMCKSCSIQRDKHGYFPLHLAAQEGHVEVVEKLLDYCPDPTEMLDNCKCNILHIAAMSGKHEMVRYILRTAKLREMINQKNENGDTPLHVATRSCHPKTVYYLTWDANVDLGLVNQKNETALDIANALYRLDESSMRQQLTWTALKSAGAKPSSSSRVESMPSVWVPYERRQATERYSGRVETLTVVSTLIITASVAACLAVPGEADGAANNLYDAMFQFFVICITISFFSSISATIILFWARLGLLELLAQSLKIVMPLLGVALISLSLAFSAGVYTVISKLSWLATVFVAMTMTFVVVVSLLYFLLFLPSSSTSKPLRYISYYPFLYLASLAEPKTKQGTNF